MVVRCEICDLSYISPLQYDYHMVSFHGVTSNLVAKKAKYSKKVYSCRFCKDTVSRFSSAGRLLNHLKNYHPDEKQRSCRRVVPKTFVQVKLEAAEAARKLKLEAPGKGRRKCGRPPKAASLVRKQETSFEARTQETPFDVILIEDEEDAIRRVMTESGLKAVLKSGVSVEMMPDRYVAPEHAAPRPVDQQNNALDVSDSSVRVSPRHVSEYVYPASASTSDNSLSQTLFSDAMSTDSLLTELSSASQGNALPLLPGMQQQQQQQQNLLSVDDLLFSRFDAQSTSVSNSLSSLSSAAAPTSFMPEWEEDESLRFYCKECRCSFTSGTWFDAHMRKVHPRPGVRRFVFSESPPATQTSGSFLPADLAATIPLSQPSSQGTPFVTSLPGEYSSTPTSLAPTSALSCPPMPIFSCPPVSVQPAVSADLQPPTSVPLTPASVQPPTSAPSCLPTSTSVPVPSPPNPAPSCPPITVPVQPPPTNLALSSTPALIRPTLNPTLPCPSTSAHIQSSNSALPLQSATPILSCGTSADALPQGSTLILSVTPRFAPYQARARATSRSLTSTPLPRPTPVPSYPAIVVSSQESTPKLLCSVTQASSPSPSLPSICRTNSSQTDVLSVVTAPKKATTSGRSTQTNGAIF